MNQGLVLYNTRFSTELPVGPVVSGPTTPEDLTADDMKVIGTP